MADDKQAHAEPKRVRVDLAGQVAIVTGASQGIGRAIAETLAANGATVALVARSAGKLADVAAAIRAAGGTAEEFPCDVSKSADVQAVVDAIHAKLGRIDILVNNAGVTRDTLLPRMSDEEWDEVLTTNLRGPFLFMRAASRPMMQQRYGRIVNVASVSRLIGNPGQSNYSASKAGLVGLTRTVAKELAHSPLCPWSLHSADFPRGPASGRMPARHHAAATSVAAPRRLPSTRSSPRSSLRRSSGCWALSQA